jgi:hypothetical protein
MALIRCSECEANISSKARACPHCGCPQLYERTKTKSSAEKRNPSQYSEVVSDQNHSKPIEKNIDSKNDYSNSQDVNLPPVYQETFWEKLNSFWGEYQVVVFSSGALIAVIGGIFLIINLMSSGFSWVNGYFESERKKKHEEEIGTGNLVDLIMGPPTIACELNVSGGIFSADYEIINKSDSPCRKVSLEFKVKKPDGTELVFNRVADLWKPGEPISINMPNNSYQQFDLKGTCEIFEEDGCKHFDDWEKTKFGSKNGGEYNVKGFKPNRWVRRLINNSWTIKAK